MERYFKQKQNKKQKLCKYGNNCTRNHCKYIHPQTLVIQQGNMKQNQVKIVNQLANIKIINSQQNSAIENLEIYSQENLQKGEIIQITDAEYQKKLYEKQPVVQKYYENELNQHLHENMNKQETFHQYRGWRGRNRGYRGGHRNWNRNLKYNQETKLSKRHLKHHESSEEQNSDAGSQTSSPEQKFQAKQRPYKKQSQNQQKAWKWKKKLEKFNFVQRPINQQLYHMFNYYFYGFFEQRNINLNKRQKIVQFLAKRFESAEDYGIQMIIPIVQELQRQGGFVQHFCYKKIIKVICNQGFDYQRVRQKLTKKMNIDAKRKKKDEQLYKKFPNPVQVEFLESEDLVKNQLVNKNTIYLVDGNNCMVTQKHIRSYFQSYQSQKKAEAQIRLRWLLSLAIGDPKRCMLFFDNKYPQQMIDGIKKQILFESQYNQALNLTQVIYPEKGQQADLMIKKKLLQLKTTLSQKQLANIILITADRLLTQECYQIIPLRKSSGMYFFKFCRKIIKHRFYNKSHPLKKGVLKRILMRRFQ